MNFVDIVSGLSLDMKEALVKLLSSGNTLPYIQQLDRQVNHERDVDRWTEAQGERVLRLNYALTPDSVVFDVGGYAGNWAAAIHCLYGCTVHVFEPMPSFAEVIRQRFAHNPKIHIHAFGLSGSNDLVQLSLLGDGSSSYRGEKDSETVKMVDVAEFMNEHTRTVDLMKLNIEGGEYDVLPRLIAADKVRDVTNIQVQFHDFVAECDSRRASIQEELRKTHEQTYNYDFIWESWTRRK